MNHILKNTKGEIYVLTCVIILIILLLFSLTFAYISLNIVIENERRMIENELENYLTQKAKEIFNNLKNGYEASTDFDKYDFANEAKEYISLIHPSIVRMENIIIEQNLDNGIRINFFCDLIITQDIFLVKHEYRTNIKTSATYIPNIF